MKRLNHGQLADLVKRAGQGDQEAFAVLYAATVEHQLYFATVFLKDASLAEDAVQETYLALYRSLGKLNNPRLFVAYLNRICYNACAVQANKRARRLDELDGDDFSFAADRAVDNNPEERYAALERNSELLEALSLLGDKHRAAFLMRYYHEMKIHDIAVAMDCSERTVKRYVSAAAGQLKNQLRKKSHFDGRGMLVIMSILRFSPFYGLLRESSRLAAPDPEMLQQMLNAVIETSGSAGAVGVTGAASIGVVSYAKALSGANKLVSAAKTGFTIQAVAVGAGLAVASVGVAVVPPEITGVWLDNGGGYTRQAEAIVTTQNALPFATVRLIPDSGGAPVAASAIEGGRYTAIVRENGVYTVEVANSNGRTAFSSIEVDCIDSTIPVIDNFTTDENYLYIHFADSQSGVAWDSVHAVSQDGTMISPVEVHPEKGIAVFPLPDSDTTFYVEDNAGNQAKTVCSVRKP